MLYDLHIHVETILLPDAKCSKSMMIHDASVMCRKIDTSLLCCQTPENRKYAEGIRDYKNIQETNLSVET